MAELVGKGDQYIILSIPYLASKPSLESHATRVIRWKLL
jgi:hypothetical protein